MAANNARRRTFHPKVKTGCRTCKSRRVKCDEGKPICKRCQGQQLECQYGELPKPWTVRSFLKHSTDGTSSSPGSLVSLSDPCAFIDTSYGTTDERRALDYYLNDVGPWLANYSSPAHRSLWQAVLPRIAKSFPAARHGLTAIGLLVMPVGSSDPAALQARAHKIIRSYTKALQELARPDIHYVDAALGPFMACTLEAISFNEARAGMHARGAKRHFLATGPKIRGFVHDEYIFDSKLELMLWHAFQVRCLRCKHPAPVMEDGQFFIAITMRNVISLPLDMDKLRADLEDFVCAFNPAAMTLDDIRQSEDFGRTILFTLAQVRSQSALHPTIGTAIHIIADLITLILPTPVIHNVAGDETLGIAIDYVTDECYWLGQYEEIAPREREVLQHFVNMMLRLIASHGPCQERRVRARDMLSCLKRTGTLKEAPWTMPQEFAGMQRYERLSAPPLIEA